MIFKRRARFLKGVTMKYRLFSIGILLLGVGAFFPEAPGAETPAAAQAKPILTQAVMCETVRDGAPHNPAVLFSIGIGRVSCYTTFDPVPERSYIHHNWYFRDTLSTKIRLTLQSPRWSTFSSIQLREADRGPWRVEITDPEGKTIKVLRFTISDG
jgi:hypothetical protein